MKAVSMIFRSMLEMLRIMLIFLFLGSILSMLLRSVYFLLNMNLEYPILMLGSIGVLILLFVLYRNKFQFSGWYNGEVYEKLSRRTTKILYTLIITLFILPIILQLLIN